MVYSAVGCTKEQQQQQQLSWVILVERKVVYAAIGVILLATSAACALVHWWTRTRTYHTLPCFGRDILLTVLHSLRTLCSFVLTLSDLNSTLSYGPVLTSSYLAVLYSAVLYSTVHFVRRYRSVQHPHRHRAAQGQREGGGGAGGAAPCCRAGDAGRLPVSLVATCLCCVLLCSALL